MESNFTGVVASDVTGTKISAVKSKLMIEKMMR